MPFLRNTLAAAALLGASLAAAVPGPAQATEFLRLSTLGPGSSPYLVMSTFAQIVSGELDEVEIQVNATGAATRHAIDAARGDTDFFMGSPTVHAAMMSGTRMYSQVAAAPELSTQVAALLTFPIGSYHFLTYADSGITELEDLAGRRVFLGPPGGGALAVARRLVELSTGLSTEDDMELIQLGWDAAAQAFQDGQLDVYVNPTIAPSPVIQQLGFSRPLRLLAFREDHLARAALQPVLDRPGGTIDTIPADIYGDSLVNDGDITTIGSNVHISAGLHLDDDLVYRMVKTFWENVEATRDGAPWMRRVVLEDAMADMNMPLHPGAQRYYEELGMTVPDALVHRR